MKTSIQFGDGGVRIDLHSENGDPQHTYLVLMGEDDLRRILREEIAAQEVNAPIRCAVQVNGGLVPAEVRLPYQPRPGYRFAEDGQGGFTEEPIPSFDPQVRT